MRPPKPRLSQGRVEAALDDTISDADMCHLHPEDHGGINALLQAAYDAKARGDAAPLEPLHILVAEERARFNASRS